jgi:pimeloyl-ACP methyl ester carboxylesterase
MVTVQADAYVLHQIVSWTKAQGYNQVNLIGHSYGSIVTAQEAGTYNDATRVVLTGLTHALDGPATLDPEFALSTLDVGYLTTLPGSRHVFYSSFADPAVITYDEAHKDLFSEAGVTSEATTFFVPAPLNASNGITAPVLLLLGQEDALFCTLPAALDCSSSDSLLHAEQPYYTAAASLTTKIVPKTGHDIALHPSAPQSFQVIETWIETH